MGRGLFDRTEDGRILPSAISVAIATRAWRMWRPHRAGDDSHAGRNHAIHQGIDVYMELHDPVIC